MTLIDRLLRRLAVALGLVGMNARLEEQNVLLGRLAISQLCRRPQVAGLSEVEFKVFSQFGDDGILQYLIWRTQISGEECSFVEFGVQDYCESNTRFLLYNDNWRGLVLDGDAGNIAVIRASEYYWRHSLTAVQAFIDKDNIDSLLRQHGFTGDIGLLSIDIDGNDYWVWQAISAVRPVIVVIEYNATFGDSRAVTIPYDATFVRSSAHYSNLYWGTSIAALKHLADEKGYVFVGTNSAGNNAYFVRADRAGLVRGLSTSAIVAQSRFRESRGPDGELTYLEGNDRLAEIAERPLVDVSTGDRICVGDLLEP